MGFYSSELANSERNLEKYIPLQKLVFLNFYSLKEATYEAKITLFYSSLFISIALINLLSLVLLTMR